MARILNRIKLFDIVIILFCLITGIYILFGFKQLENIFVHILIRIVFLITIFSLIRISDSNSQILLFLRNFYPFLLLGFFYSETDYYNNLIFKNFDPLLVNIESWFFGSQPSLEFSKLLPYPWFSELMHFGYFSFYLISIGFPLFIYFKKHIVFEKTIFVLILSFCLYYTIFILFPSIGPQFYFPADQTTIPDAYLFKYFMDLIITNFETQTGTFPSSHVGITVVILLLTHKEFKTLFNILLPLSLILCLATVYLKAHYLIDVFGGIISGIIFYWISIKLFINLQIEKRE